MVFIPPMLVTLLPGSAGPGARPTWPSRSWTASGHRSPWLAGAPSRSIPGPAARCYAISGCVAVRAPVADELRDPRRRGRGWRRARGHPQRLCGAGRAPRAMAVVLFDVLRVGGQDVMREPWGDRRKRRDDMAAGATLPGATIVPTTRSACGICGSAGAILATLAAAGDHVRVRGRARRSLGSRLCVRLQEDSSCDRVVPTLSSALYRDGARESSSSWPRG